MILRVKFLPSLNYHVSIIMGRKFIIVLFTILFRSLFGQSPVGNHDLRGTNYQVTLRITYEFTTKLKWYNM